MPNKVSAAKRARQNLKRRARNRTARASLRTAVKTAKESIESKQNVQPAVKNAQSVIGKMTKRGIVHHRTAARITSRLMKKANRLAKEGATA